MRPGSLWAPSTRKQISRWRARRGCVATEETTHTRRQDKSRRGCLATHWAGERARRPLPTIDVGPVGFLCRSRAKARSLGSFWPVLRAACLQSGHRWRNIHTYCGGAVPARPHAEGRTWQNTRFSRLEKEEAPPRVATRGGAVAPTSFPRTPTKTTEEGRWRLTAESTGALGAIH
jgi:hypothetical protein